MTRHHQGLVTNLEKDKFYIFDISYIDRSFINTDKIQIYSLLLVAFYLPR